MKSETSFKVFFLVTFPHNFGKLFLKNTQKISSKKNKASSFEQYSSFHFASPQTKPWSLMTPSLNKSTLSEWISLECQTCPLPSRARLCNNSGSELLFVFILTMVFKVFSPINSPCLWSFQVPCRFYFIKVWLASLQTYPWRLYCQALLVPLAYWLRASPRRLIGSPWSYQKRFLTFLCYRT